MQPMRHTLSARRHASGADVTVGVDVGGTWVRVVAGAGERRIRVVTPASAVAELGKFLRTLWRRHGWTRRDVAALVVASRGIWTASERARQARRLRGLAGRVVVLSDAQAALLGALGTEPGLLVLAGTGSIVVGRSRNGRWARAGGLGPLLGDEGSGFWLGRQWLRLTTQGEDVMPARRLVRAPDAVARIAALAPVVLRRARRGDRRARAIVAAAHTHLAAFAVSVARQLGLRAPVAVSWAGSLMGDDAFRAGVRRALSRAGLSARWTAPAEEPVAAAARLAARLSRRRRRRAR
jgi:N-acetylglucosamine kinase-like BadF-type ATPase